MGCLPQRLPPTLYKRSLSYSQMMLLICLNFSFIVINDLTCRNDIPDSRWVISMLLPLSVNHPLATSTLSSLWMKRAKLLMWVSCTPGGCIIWMIQLFPARQPGPYPCAPQQQCFLRKCWFGWCRSTSALCTAALSFGVCYWVILPDDDPLKAVYQALVRYSGLHSRWQSYVVCELIHLGKLLSKGNFLQALSRLAPQGLAVWKAYHPSFAFAPIVQPLTEKHSVGYGCPYGSLYCMTADDHFAMCSCLPAFPCLRGFWLPELDVMSYTCRWPVPQYCEKMVLTIFD